MKMNIIIAVSLLGLTIGTNLSAQTVNTLNTRDSLHRSAATNESRAQMQTENLKNILALSAEQVIAVHNILLKYDQKLADSFKTNSSPEGRKQAFTQINEDKDAEMKGVLTSEQFAKYQQNKHQVGHTNFSNQQTPNGQQQNSLPKPAGNK